MIRELEKKDFAEKFPEISTYGLEHSSPVFLENGAILTDGEWNGEVYTIKENGAERSYRPQREEMDNDQWETVGYIKEP